MPDSGPGWPQVVIFEETDEELAAGALAEAVEDLGIAAPFVLHSDHGSRLARSLDAVGRVRPPAASPDQSWASTLGAGAKESGADAVVAIGGGRCLDVGKLAAARAGLSIVTVPTQLSHDGLCSPVAVVPDGSGKPQSLGAITPRSVFVSLPTIAGAPGASLRAGIGDLLANPLALRDWALAAERGLEAIDDRAWAMSTESFELIEPYLDADPAARTGDVDFLRGLANALILSGMAMIQSGTSRPASGGEHEVSHAIDELFGPRAMHGEQVAFGCIFSAALHGEDVAAFRTRLAVLGLPSHPRDLGLSTSEVARVLLHAPDTRPGRFTILEEANLDDKGVAELVEGIFGE